MPQRVPPTEATEAPAPAPAPAAPAVPDAAAPSPSEIAGDRAQLEHMREYFNAQPKRRVRCRNDEYVSVNGYSFFIKANEWVNVPEDIAQMLEDGDRI